MQLRAPVPRQADNKSGVPEEREVWGSQAGGKDKDFPSTFLSLSHIRHFFLKPRTDGYTTNSSAETLFQGRYNNSAPCLRAVAPPESLLLSLASQNARYGGGTGGVSLLLNSDPLP